MLWGRLQGPGPREAQTSPNETSHAILYSEEREVHDMNYEAMSPAPHASLANAACTPRQQSQGMTSQRQSQNQLHPWCVRVGNSDALMKKQLLQRHPALLGRSEAHAAWSAQQGLVLRQRNKVTKGSQRRLRPRGCLNFHM